MRYAKRKQWTKEELKKFVQLWETKTSEELAKDFHVKKSSITSIASKFRKAGLKLTRKRIGGVLDSLIKEVVKEMK